MGDPYVPLAFIAIYSAIAVQIVNSNNIRTLVGVAITVMGIPFYYVLSRKKREVPICASASDCEDHPEQDLVHQGRKVNTF